MDLWSPYYWRTGGCRFFNLYQIEHWTSWTTILGSLSTPHQEKCDIAVIGFGSGGYAAAQSAAWFSRKIDDIEKNPTLQPWHDLFWSDGRNLLGWKTKVEAVDILFYCVLLWWINTLTSLLIKGHEGYGERTASRPRPGIFLSFQNCFIHYTHHPPYPSLRPTPLRISPLRPFFIIKRILPAVRPPALENCCFFFIDLCTFCNKTMYFL